MGGGWWEGVLSGLTSLNVFSSGWGIQEPGLVTLNSGDVFGLEGIWICLQLPSDLWAGCRSQDKECMIGIFSINALQRSFKWLSFLDVLT